MKEGIHPAYRDVCFVDLSNGFKFVTRSCAQTRETIKMDDGRELPLSSSRPPASRTRSTPARRRASTSWAAASRSSATSSRTSAPRSEPLAAVGTKAASAAFFVAACIRGCLTTVRATHPTRPWSAQRAAQRRCRALALLLFCAAYVLPGLFGRDPWKSADITAFGYMVNIAEGRTSWLAPTRRRPAGRRRAAAVLARRRCSIKLRRRAGSTRPSPRASRSRCCWPLALALTWYATYHLARTEAAQPLPFAFGGEAHAGRLCARHRRRRAAGADRLPRPAAARPRDDARAGAAVRGRAVPLRRWRAAPFRRRARAACACCSALPLLAASGAPSDGHAARRSPARRGAARARRYAGGARASRAGSPRRPRSPCAVGVAARHLGLAPRVGLPAARRCCAACAHAAVVHLAGLAAGAVDAVALAPAPAAAATSRCRSAWSRVGAGRRASAWAAPTAR